MASAELAIGRAIKRGRGLAVALADVEPWIVGPILVAGLMAPRWLGPALVVAAAFWLVRWVARGSLTVRTGGDRFIAVLLLMIPVTLRVTTLPYVTQRQVLWLLTGVAFYYAIVNWAQTFKRERVILLGLVGAGLIAALVAPFAVTWVTDIKFTFIPKSLYASLPLLVPVPSHPNVLAGALVLGLPIPLALLMFEGPRIRSVPRLASAAAVAGIAIILVLTKSRGALLAAFVAVMVLSMLRWRRGWIFILVAALLATVALWQIGFEQVGQKLTSTGSIVGFPGRLEIWSRGVFLVRDFPLSGVGMGTFEPVAKRLYPFSFLGPRASVPHAHNIFLQVAVDLGLPGLAAWLGLLAAASLSAWRVYQAGKRGESGWALGAGAGLLASQLALVVHGMVDAAVWGAHSAIVVWVVWAVCMASYNLRRAPERVAVVEAREASAHDRSTPSSRQRV